MEQLKECPLCGGKAKLIKTISVKVLPSGQYKADPPGSARWLVKCDFMCGISTGCYITVESAIGAWNRRGGKA
jgi:hypothetical protein